MKKVSKQKFDAKVKKYSQKTIRRFFKHVKKTKRCWLWTASKMWKGYGNFRLNKKTLLRSHRFAYEIFKGRIPRNKLVCHKCDVRNCVKPQHLWLGTPELNSKDMVKKKRQSKGEDLPHSVLTVKKVKRIRREYKHNKRMTQARLAKKYHVNSSVISEIVNRISWKSVR